MQQGCYGQVVLLDNGLTFYDKEKYKLNNPWELLQHKLDSMGIPNVNFHQEMYAAYSDNKSNIIHPEENLHYSANGHKLLANTLLKHSLKK